LTFSEHYEPEHALVDDGDEWKDEVYRQLFYSENALTDALEKTVTFFNSLLLFFGE